MPFSKFFSCIITIFNIIFHIITISILTNYLITLGFISLFLITFKVLGFSFDYYNIDLKKSIIQLLLPKLKGLLFFHIIVSCKLNPIFLAYNACLKLVPVSLPLIVESLTTHTTT